MYFSVTSPIALGRMADYLGKRFVPRETHISLKRLVFRGYGLDYPILLKLEGLRFELVSEGDVLLPSDTVLVRTKDVYVNHGGNVAKAREGIDIYPKFRRADWYSGLVAFRVDSIEGLEDFVSTFPENNLKYFKESYLGGVVYLTVKESDISMTSERPSGLVVVDYSGKDMFPSPLVVV